MGCTASRTGSDLVGVVCHAEESTSTNNAESQMCDCEVRVVQHKRDLGRFCDELTSSTPIPTPLIPSTSPDRALCLGKTRELDDNAVTLSSASPVSHVCVPESTMLKDFNIHIKPTDVSSMEVVTEVRSTYRQPTLEWLQLHHNYQLPPLKDPQQQQEQQQQHVAAYDISRCGDGVSEHWSTRLSPTMRSETSLHHSVTCFEPNAELGSGINGSVASDLSRMGQDGDEEQGGPYSRDASILRNPVISVIAPDSPTESKHSYVDSPVMALTSMVDRVPSAVLHSPTGLDVLDQPHLMMQPTMMDPLVGGGGGGLGMPSGDTGEITN